MTIIEELTEYFRKFPGVGPRQASRFVYYLLRQSKENLNKLASLIPELADHVSTCSKCQRYFMKKQDEEVCKVCSDPNRNKQKLIVISHDSDFESVERSGSFDGFYFILGGIIPILEKEPEKKIRLGQLKKRVSEMIPDQLEEVILALNANPEGDNTAYFIKNQLEKEYSHLKITTLGRGLSTGTELEYSDSDTIKNALKNRF